MSAEDLLNLAIAGSLHGGVRPDVGPEIERLTQEIAQLDLESDAGSLDPPDYNARRAELIERLLLLQELGGQPPDAPASSGEL